MDTLVQDVRRALRSLRRDPGFTTAAVLTLAIGIGLNTAVFSVVRATLLEPLPYAEPSRLVMLWSSLPEEGIRETSSAYANVQDWREQSRTLEDLATYDPVSLTLTGGAWPEQVSAAQASANLFEVLGVSPVLGRPFTEEEELRRDAVVVVSHEFWRERFGASHDAIERTVEIAGAPFQVVGILPEGVRLPEGPVQLWVPQTLLADGEAMASQRGTGPWRVVGRLRPGVRIEQARGELASIAARLAERYPETDARLTISAVPLHVQVMGRTTRVALWTLFGAVSVVLVMACANSAQMIVARAMRRGREFAVRSALGAGMGRLVSQALTESLLLALASGLAGVLLAGVTLRLFVGLAPVNIPRLEQAGIDVGVLIYASVVSVCVGVLFGIAPALGFSRSPDYQSLRAGRSSAERTRGQRVRRLLITLQFALAIVLVFGAGMLVQSLLKMTAVDPGFRTDDVFMANLSAETAVDRTQFYQQVLQEVRTIPGVVSAGLIEDLFVSGAPNRTIQLESGAWARPTLAPLRIDAIAGDLFHALDVSLLEGRGFTSADQRESVPVAVINQTMARRFWPGEPAVGKRFRTGDGGSDAAWVEVVGVVGDMHRQGPDAEPIPQAFRPYHQDPSRNMVLLIRREGAVPGLATMVRTRIATIDATVPLYMITTLDEAMDRYFRQRRFATSMLGLFAVVALVLAAVGTFGLVQYSVSQRAHEIGVRIAVGGRPGQVVRMFVTQALALAVPGTLVGLGCSVLVSRLVSSVFHDPGVYEARNALLTTAVLLLTAILAGYVPARRAAKVDPIAALRSQ